MKRISNRISSVILALICFSCVNAIIGQDETVPASTSDLTGIKLPPGTTRVVESSIPADVDLALDKLVASADGKLRQGNREVLAWTDGYKRSQAPRLVKQVTDGLGNSGWTYEAAGENDGVTVFTVLRATPSKRAVVGFYTFSDDALVLAWTEVLSNGSQSTGPKSVPTATTNSATASGSPGIFNVEKGAHFVNVMGTQMPEMPKFPALSPKPGKVRGYVKDASGKALAGAAIGVRSTLIGGAYSGAQGKTDANGYYEFAVPRGVAHYYNAGYAVEYGDGLAAIGLHAVDGGVDSFASTDGAVENFVLLSYGITNRANLQESPRLPATYYGGSLYIGHWVVEASDAGNQPKSLVENSVVEITLTPDGPLADGTAGKSFVVRKTTASYQSGFYVHNIPVGRYKVTAKLNGKNLRMKLNKPVGTMFGMTPAETTGEANILFHPGSAQASMVVPNYGAWNAVEIIIERP